MACWLLLLLPFSSLGANDWNLRAAAQAHKDEALDKIVASASPSPRPVVGLANLHNINTKVVLINVYAGPLLVTYPLLVESARRNPLTTWLLVHLGENGPAVDLSSRLNWANNLVLVKSTAEEMKQLAVKQLNDTGNQGFDDTTAFTPVKPALTQALGYKVGVFD